MKLIFYLFMIFISIRSNAQDFELTFNHYAINVLDIQNSVDFYENVLRLKQIPNGTEQEHIRWFSIGNHLELHIIEAETKNINVPKGVHLSLTLPNIKAFMNFLDSKQIHYETWNGEPKTSNFRPDDVNQIYIQDPDGYWIEINDAAKKR